jgi:hypothetical protein
MSEREDHRAVLQRLADTYGVTGADLRRKFALGRDRSSGARAAVIASWMQATVLNLAEDTPGTACRRPAGRFLVAVDRGTDGGGFGP